MSQHQTTTHMYNLLCEDSIPAILENAAAEPDEYASQVELVLYAPHPEMMHIGKKGIPAAHLVERVVSKLSSFEVVSETKPGFTAEFGRMQIASCGPLGANFLASSIHHSFFYDRTAEESEYLFVPNSFRDYIIILRFLNPNPEYEVSLDSHFNPGRDQLFIVSRSIVLVG